MIKIDVKCVRKTDSVDGNGQFTSEVTLIQTTQDSIPPVPNQYAIGAAIGTPNATLQSNPVTLANPTKVKYNLNTALNITIDDAEEALKYAVGQVYTISVNTDATTEKVKK